MLSLSEISSLRATVDDNWRSPLADAVAARWGIPPGAARWWRSSASHVFVVPREPERRDYLRFVRADSVEGRRMPLIAAVLERWAAAGLGAARPVATANGEFVASAATTGGGVMTAMLVHAVGGEELDVDELTLEHASLWGASLAHVHEVGAAPDSLPRSPHIAASPSSGRTEAGGHTDAFIAARIQAAVDSLDPARHARGALHGDFELDNLRFGDRVEFFDADEAHYGWIASDIALAVRELLGEEGAPRPEHLTAFLDGYRSVRALGDDDERSIPLHSLHHSARTVTDVALLDLGDDPDAPEWEQQLRNSLAEHVEWHRARLHSAEAAEILSRHRV